MPFVAPKPSESNFAPPPAGSHAAVCYRLIDLGTQQSTFNNETKRQHKIVVSWELPDEKMEDGKPYSIHQRYTFSLHEKAKLRADLEGWRGRNFTEAELEAFDLEVLLGKPCLLSVVHEERQGKVYANIKSVSRLPKGMPAPTGMANPACSFILSNPDWTVFESLSDGLKETIKKSPEYAEAVKPNNGHAAEHVPQNGGDSDSDAIPF